MALSADITLDKKDGSDVVFGLPRMTLDGSVRIDPTSTLALPNLLQIKHAAQGTKGNVVDRHLVQRIRAVDCDGVRKDIVVNITIQVPQDPNITEAMVLDTVHESCDFCVDGALTTTSTMANISAVIRNGS